MTNDSSVNLRHYLTFIVGWGEVVHQVAEKAVELHGQGVFD